MYRRNTIARRRSSGWADRRRYFRRLVQPAQPKAVKAEETPKGAPQSDKD